MIHAFALEPRFVATWGRQEEFRLIHDKFGLGTPRALLELLAFSKWKRAVYAAADKLALSQEDMKRIRSCSGSSASTNLGARIRSTCCTGSSDATSSRGRRKEAGEPGS